MDWKHLNEPCKRTAPPYIVDAIYEADRVNGGSSNNNNNNRSSMGLGDIFRRWSTCVLETGIYSIHVTDFSFDKHFHSLATYSMLRLLFPPLRELRRGGTYHAELRRMHSRSYYKFPSCVKHDIESEHDFLWKLHRQTQSTHDTHTHIHTKWRDYKGKWENT